jgi:polyhydroxyalkanoate synthesis repressor PhaR
LLDESLTGVVCYLRNLRRAISGASYGGPLLSETKGGASGPVVIKKYANRRLYNTQTSTYVTLDHLAQMVKDGTDFEVHDARTGEDITRQVLTQIIVEEEAKGGQMLPIQFLRQLIGFYGDSLQTLVPGYLEMSMDSFAKNQQAMREKFADAFGGRLGFKEFEQLTKQNLQMFEQAMRAFSPFTPPGMAPTRETPPAPPPRTNGTSEPPPARDDEMRALKDQLAAMQKAIADLAQQRK